MTFGMGRSGRRRLGGFGTSARCRLTMPMAESALKGRSPVTSW